MPHAHWRTGRRIGRTIYLQRYDDPSDRDQLIGMMDTAGLSDLVCKAVNYWIESQVPTRPYEGPESPS